MLSLALLGLGTGSASAAGSRSAAPKQLHRQRVSSDAVSLTRSTTLPSYVCPHGACEAIADPRPSRRPGSARFALPRQSRLLEGSGELGGFDPEDLRAAYQIPTSGGSGLVVAVVDAFGYPAAESDLAKYRSRYGLPACTKASGCFKKVNQSGEEGKYPAAEAGWEEESALDLDMVSAACPSCKIMLVEASTELPADTGASVNTAATLGAAVISNSYGYPEEYEPWCGKTGCTAYTSDYVHSGVEVVASAGDSGYDNVYDGLTSPNFPAAVPNVIAVGGTSLKKAKNARGWSETVWGEATRSIGTGSGCSLFQSKPSWQKDPGCSKRTGNDIAAVAACNSPVSVYAASLGGWENLCGTSASSPLVAGILAHLSESERSLGVEAFYKDPAALFDVTSGTNGACTTEYLCTGEVGYDGPTGLGTPDELPGVVKPTVTAVEPASGPSAGGTLVTIRGTGLANATAVDFGGAPASFTVNTASSITATAPAGTGTVDVTVADSAGTSETSPADHFAYAEGPEFGRCIKVATGTGRFAGGTCVSSTSTNSYEWFPAFGGARPLEKRHFTIAAKATTKPKLETKAKHIVNCTGESGSGEYASDTTVSAVVLTFTGCTLGTSGACQSPGKASGEISTTTLDGTLGVITKSAEGPAKNKIGIDYRPASGEQVTEFGCPGTHAAVDGSVIAEVPKDSMLTAATIKFTQAKAVQKPVRFEGKPEDVLSAFFGEDGPFEPAGLLFTDVQTSEEKVEVNAVV
ncbi:MAG TPA: IPT/TIG domain-containing protein [Solirubrobacteraceae bacterium]|nr:IPT/TIG domain-containing protein [Solirubrobacteraceae bacterium]